MKDFQIKSIADNLNEYVKDFTNEELATLVDEYCYGVLETPFRKPSEMTMKFANEFIGEVEFARVITDVRNPDKLFLSSKDSTRELVRMLSMALMEKSFVRFEKLLKSKPIILSKEDKKNLREIRDEHEAMLKYQLEDEDAIRNTDSEEGQALVDEKKRHLFFLENLEI